MRSRALLGVVSEMPAAYKISNEHMFIVLGLMVSSTQERRASIAETVGIVVVNLASRPPQFLGSASSAPEGLGSHIGANLVRD